MQHLNDVYLAGVSVPELMEKYAIALNDLTPYFPADYQELEEGQIEVHYLGYYKKMDAAGGVLLRGRARGLSGAAVP